MSAGLEDARSNTTPRWRPFCDLRQNPDGISSTARVLPRDGLSSQSMDGMLQVGHPLPRIQQQDEALSAICVRATGQARAMKDGNSICVEGAGLTIKDSFLCDVRQKIPKHARE
jgi:hypothetical protein